MQHSPSILFQFILNEVLILSDLLSQAPTPLSLLGDPSSRWYFQRGRLYKLQIYYTQFSQDHKDSISKNIELLIRSAQVPDYDPQTIKELQKHLRKISSLLFEKMVQFYDENILYFVLKKQKEFDLLHGPKWISKFFKVIFPEQNHNTWISEKYFQRGFTELSSRILQG